MAIEAVEIALASDVAIILVAAALVGFVATQTGQPTIIAYIVAGLLLGPAALGLVEPGVLTETMAELGLAFLLFLLGIKMRLDEIRHILPPIVKISIPQMALVALTGTGVALALGFDIWVALIIGLAVMYSSTAVVIKMLTDKGEATSLHGKIDVGILLVQDIVVVILLAVIAAGQPDNVVDIAITLVTVLVLVFVIGVVAVVSSRYVLPPIFRRIADDTELFFLIAISWAFLFVFVASELNLSIEMGAFLAGLAIAQLPYSKELQARINPLTDLFILIFFVSVAIDLEASDLFQYLPEAVIASVILIVAKFVIFFGLLWWQNFDVETTFLGSVNMVQVSEFGLIVGAAALTQEFIDEGVLGFLTLLALFTMSVSVYAIQYNGRLFDRLESSLARWQRADPIEPAEMEYRDHVVVVGYDEIARRALGILEETYEQIVVVDRNVEHVEAIEAAGYSPLFGDFKYEKIRKEAGLKYADFVFSSSIQTDINKILLRETGEEATVFVEAATDDDAETLYELGADYVIMAPQLGTIQLTEYLETYVDDRDSFERAIQRDIALLEQGKLFPEFTDGGEPQDD